MPAACGCDASRFGVKPSQNRWVVANDQGPRIS